MPDQKITPEHIAHALGGGMELKNGDGSWNTKCPAHDDNGPSLTVSATPTGRLLVHCHAHCAQEKVISALQAKGLWPRRSKKWNAVPHAPAGTEWPESKVHPVLGPPSKSWGYYTSNNLRVGLVHRFDMPDGSKSFSSQSWGVDEEGNTGWCWKSFPKPRPLWNARRLPTWTGPVLVVEGEKAAEAAQIIVGNDYLVVTWPGGSAAAKYADWSMLKGKDVVLWPDADMAGDKAMRKVGEILVKDEIAKSVKRVTLPSDLPVGWDLADDVPEGSPMDRKLLIITASDYAPSGNEVMDELNQSYAHVWVGDKPAIINEEADAEGHLKMKYLSINAFQSHFRNRKVDDGHDEVTLANYWLDHEERRSYTGIIFRPTSTTNDKITELPRSTNSIKYNLWRGFTIEPDADGDWSMLNEHILENIAGGDEAIHRWIIGWFAQMIQQPEYKIGTSVALRGKEGTGKTIIGKLFGELIRQHYVIVGDSAHVLGNFNAHLASCLLLHADEAFWAGDPRQIGRLKDLVTNDVQQIEPKGKDVFEVQSYLRLLVTSNDDWIVPASFNARRFAVFEVGEKRMQDKPYFAAMTDQMKSGGYAGLLYHLLHFDLSTVEIGKVPSTKALLEQKIHSLSSSLRYLRECIENTEIIPGTGDWPTVIATEELYRSYIERCRMWGERRPLSREAMTKKFVEVLEGTGQFHRVRETMPVRDPRTGDLTRRRTWGYSLPPLDRAREAFENALKGEEGKKLEMNLELPLTEEPEIRDEAEDEIPF